MPNYTNSDLAIPFTVREDPFVVIAKLVEDLREARTELARLKEERDRYYNDRLRQEAREPYSY